ncbi:Mannose-binding lectin [Cynara cardunculus var. scolymus]|uniref:Mannose-binding lectin n=1 Tax=Cynara cardunculus var. scolymus TaxID=59895 RepID=A0A103YLP1_CYNCS|nr:Mannose-binding lectin [Cynara cardunculus var. scolymus]
MDTSWMSEPRSSTQFLKGLGEFLDLECKNNASASGEIKCPCIKCAYSMWVTREKATEHIIFKGIMKGYNTLIAHGEASSTEHLEVTFDVDEEIIGIDGTVGVSTGEFPGYTIISSLSFLTNKRTHGPFGKATGTPFAVPWNKGSFAGFYGLAGYYIDGIGVYLKASQETARVGLWGTESSTGPQYRWSFCLEKNHKLTKITIDHGDMISSLIFTSEDCMGSVHVSNKAGGYSDGSTISEGLKWDTYWEDNLIVVFRNKQKEPWTFWFCNRNLFLSAMEQRIAENNQENIQWPSRDMIRTRGL